MAVPEWPPSFPHPGSGHEQHNDLVGISVASNEEDWSYLKSPE